MFWENSKLSSHKSLHLWLPIVGLVILIALFITISYVNSGRFFTREQIPAMISEGWIILIQMIVMMYFVYYAIRYFDKMFGNGFSIKRYVYEILFITIAGFVINHFFNSLFIKSVLKPEEDMAALTTKLHNLLIVSQILILIAYILITGFRILNDLHQRQLKLLQLQKEFAQTQFEALKNQLNPHFLFNSLSVLTSLVYSNVDKAEKFIDKLSKTYRYLLDQHEKAAVHISNEIEFLNNFEYLIEQRYGKKIIIKKEIPEKADNLFLLPHTMLIIFEYIISGNTMSAVKPLLVEVTIKNNFLLIRYSHQPKDLSTLHIQKQFSSLLDNYQQADKEVALSSDEFSQLKIIKIPLLSI